MFRERNKFVKEVRILSAADFAAYVKFVVAGFAFAYGSVCFYAFSAFIRICAECFAYFFLLYKYREYFFVGAL